MHQRYASWPLGNPYNIALFGRELSLTLFRESLEGAWNPSHLKEYSDELCDAAYAAHRAFMKRFIGDHPLTAARAELRGHNRLLLQAFGFLSRRHPSHHCKQACMMEDKPQYTVTLLPGNEGRFLSLSRTAKIKPKYRPMGAERYHSQAAAMFAVAHYEATGEILLHSEVRAILLKRKVAKHEQEARSGASMRGRENGAKQEELRV